MFSKSNLISTLVLSIWGVFGGFLLWGIIGDPYLKNHLGDANITMKEMPDFPFLVLGCVIVAFALSVLFAKWSNGNHALSEGANFGIIMGLLVGFGHGIIDYSTLGVLDLTGTLVNGVIYVVHFLVMGILASLVFSKTSS